MLDKYKKFYKEIYCETADPKNDYKVERCLPKVLRNGKYVDMDLCCFYEVEGFKKYMKDNHNLLVIIREVSRPSVLTKIIWFIEDFVRDIKEEFKGN